MGSQGRAPDRALEELTWGSPCFTFCQSPIAGEKVAESVTGSASLGPALLCVFRALLRVFLPVAKSVAAIVSADSAILARRYPGACQMDDKETMG